MLHEAVVAVVYQTTDYSKFHKLDLNRDVTQGRLEKLVASFSAKEIMNPIIVNKNYEIIDGQGRYETKKKLGLPIYYIIDENATIEDCRRMNRYNTKWSDADFIKSYAEAGNENYILMLEVCNETKLSPSVALRLCGKGKGGKQGGFLQSGDLVFTKEDQEELRRTMKIINEAADCLNLSGRHIQDAFRVGIRVISQFEGFDIERFLRNCKKFSKRFTLMSRLEDQLSEFTDIYNFGYKNSEKKLYFQDYMRNRGANIRDYSDISFASEASQKNVSTLKTKEA